MEKLLGHPRNRVEQVLGLNTAKEISQQPEIWLETYKMISENRNKIENFLKRFIEKDNLRIILSGAGSSEFIGECAQVYLNNMLNQQVEIIATTDLVTHPEIYLKRDVPTLMISYARSGNSPESIGAVKLANQLISEIYHLMLTCNPKGELSKLSKYMDKTLVIYMPDKANDQGFAMTSSFTSMYLSTLLVFNIFTIETLKSTIEDLAAMALNILGKKHEVLQALANIDFDRIIYLGAGVMKGLARESALKMLELTAGKVGTLYDSPLGFRHGPKSYINEKTIVVLYLTNDSYARKYEIDLLKEIKKEGIAKKVIVVCHKEDDEISKCSDLVLDVSGEGFMELNDVYLSFPFLMIAQILSFNKSINLNITPDNPSPSGVVNRVVQGVTLYSYN